MKTINQKDFTTSLAVLFRETFEGMERIEENVYLSNDTGIFMTLGKIEAEEASTEINSTTIAAHSEHLRFYIELLNNYLNKNMRVIDFNRSWEIKIVNEDEWDDLRENISAIYRRTSETFGKIEEWNLDTITVAMGIIAHTAYHLGAIRQISKNFD